MLLVQESKVVGRSSKVGDKYRVRKRTLSHISILIVSVCCTCSPKVKYPAGPLSKNTHVYNVHSAHKTSPTTASPILVTASGKMSEPSIMMILPFGLNDLPNQDKDSSERTQFPLPAYLSGADIAIDYYQGFKLALDTLAKQGVNFTLQVFDSKCTVEELQNLIRNPMVQNCHLIVGPIFPRNIQRFSILVSKLQQAIVSPLSPKLPSGVGNTNYIILTPPLQYHAFYAAWYVSNRLRAKKVFVLQSKYNEDEKYSIPFRKHMASLSNQGITCITLHVVDGNLSALLPELSTSDQNIFVVPATNQQFLATTLNALKKLKSIYPTLVIGHPSWAKLSFLHPELLQQLNTYITSADQVAYQALPMMSFRESYKKQYQCEPGEYAIRGFDAGLYFGTILIRDPNALQQLDKNPYDEALYNPFNFAKRPIGWVNTHVQLLKYEHFELRPTSTF